MKATALLTVVVTVAISVFTLVVVANPRPNAPQPVSSPSAASIERGRYLVNRVGMCIDCHSPRDASGNFVESRQLTGSPLGFVPTVPMPWSPAAPRIAGLPVGFTRAETVHFLMTGDRPHGRPGVLPPMPPYRLDRPDAEAIAAYLESLPVGPSE